MCSDWVVILGGVQQRPLVSDDFKFNQSELITGVGVPHRVSQEDVYNGYRIPAGSMILANQW